MCAKGTEHSAETVQYRTKISHLHQLLQVDPLIIRDMAETIPKLRKSVFRDHDELGSRVLIWGRCDVSMSCNSQELSITHHLETLFAQYDQRFVPLLHRGRVLHQRSVPSLRFQCLERSMYILLAEYSDRLSA